MLRAAAFYAVAVLLISVSGRHVSSGDDNEELAGFLKGSVRKHFVTKFSEKVSMSDIMKQLPHASHVRPVPGGGHCIFTSLDNISKMPWKVLSVKEMKSHHKCKHALVEPSQPTPTSFVVTLTEDMSTEEIVSILLARDIPVDKIRKGKQSSATDVKVEILLKSHENYNAALKTLSSLDNVRWMEKSRSFEPQNNIASWTTQGEVVDTHPLWDAGFDGSGEIVHIGDTGLDYDACFFHDPDQTVKFYPESNPLHRKVLSYVECQDFEIVDHQDQRGAHGTHVAGTFTGKSLSEHKNMNGGVPEAKLVFGDLQCGGRAMFLPPDLFELYEPGRVMGARVSSNSWGSTEAPVIYQGTETETDSFTWNNPNFLPVFAAGNRRNGGILSPATSKNSLTVGAHVNNPNKLMRDQVASFSARGPTYDRRPKPDIMAPGKSLTSSASDGSLHTFQCSLESKEGTSMATPVVAAAATMVRQYFRSGYYPSGTKNPSHAFEPSSTLIKAMIIHSGEHMSSVKYNDLPNSDEGFGRMQIYNLIPGTKHERVYVVNGDHVKQDQNIVRCFTLSSAPKGVKTGTVNFRATMTFLDPPAAEGSHYSLVNDIDLTIQTPSGDLLRSNASKFHTGNNNVERIEAAEFIPGKYLVIITGYDVIETHPFVGVPYSLVVSGASLKHESDITKCAPLGCPKVNGKVCNGKGTCNQQTGLCECDDSHHHVACDLCSNQHLCNDRGTCNEDTLQCQCILTAVGNNCESCAEGWFGPKCEGDCNCVHGTCNKETGLCTCDDHWQGSHCDRCDTNLRGETCEDKSHWCVNRQIINIKDQEGYIEISSGPKYDNGMNCMWLIQPPSPENEVEITFNWIQIENKFDYIHVFAGETVAAKQLYSFARGTGSGDTVTSTGTTLIRFISDSIENEKGFELHYKIKKTCPTDGNSYCNGHGRCVGSGDCECIGVWDPETLCKTKRLATTPTPTAAPIKETPVPTPYPTTISNCPHDGNAYCNNNGRCINNGQCSCNEGYDPATLCKDLINAPTPTKLPVAVTEAPALTPQSFLVCDDPSHCRCKKGSSFRGKECSVQFENWWSPYVCNGHGDQHPNDNTCTCLSGWKGENCQWCSKYDCITSELTFSVPYHHTLSTETTFFKMIPNSLRGAGIKIKVCLSSPKWHPYTVAIWVGDYYPLESNWNKTGVAEDLCLTVTGWNEEDTVYVLGLKSEVGAPAPQLIRLEVVSEEITPELYGISVEVQDPEHLDSTGFDVISEGILTDPPTPAPIARRGLMFLAIGLLIGVFITVVPITLWWKVTKSKRDLEKNFERKEREMQEQQK